jgi:hypothetical protein
MNKVLTDTRITGLLYLGLALTGVFVFMVVRPQLFVSGDALATSSNLVQKESLARQGVAVELMLVAFQALAAVWFYKLFSKINGFAAGLVAVFGMVNAIAILISSAMWLGALNAAIGGEAPSLVFNLFGMHETIWRVSGLFFGLWLLPMGYLSAKAKVPKVLVAFILAGGIGYILSTFLLILFPSQKPIANMMTLPATIGEFWMIGYLLVKPRLNRE